MSQPLGKITYALAQAALDAVALGDDEALTARTAGLIRRADAERGDLALPCFELAKRLQQNPADVARKLAAALCAHTVYRRVEAVGPYVNVDLDTGKLATAVLPLVRAADYASGPEGEGKTVVIDFSSPNIAKPLGFHHIRTTVIGAAISRLHKKRGWRVVGINYLGDWGKQFGLLATGFHRYGDPELRSDAKHLVEVYVKASHDADVEGRQGAIARPAEAKNLHDTLVTERRKVADEADAKAKKTGEKRVQNLERKLRQLRGLKDDADPLASWDTYERELEQKKDDAERALPEALRHDREARLFFKKLEEKDPAAIAEWREFREASLAEFRRIYSRMGIEFFAFEGESFYTDLLEQTIARIQQRPGTEENSGALVAKLAYKDGEPPILLRTGDGTTLYLTRDIAAAIDRFDRFRFDRSLYVVAADQSFHFAQLVRILHEMGFSWADRITHVAFGRVHGMSTRRGQIVFLDEVLDEAVERAKAICEQSDRIDRARLSETAEAIGVGAVVFGDLKNLRMSDYTFRLDDVVNFDGLTGPYVQYTHARLCSILKRAADAGRRPDETVLHRISIQEEKRLILELLRIPDAMQEACDAFEPSILTRAILDVAQAAAHYLTSGTKDEKKRVLVEGDPELCGARLYLVDAARNTIRIGLEILGVTPIEAM